jgi:hypothetical protein
MPSSFTILKNSKLRVLGSRCHAMGEACVYAHGAPQVRARADEVRVCSEAKRELVLACSLCTEITSSPARRWLPQDKSCGPHAQYPRSTGVSPRLHPQPQPTGTRPSSRQPLHRLPSTSPWIRRSCGILTRRRRTRPPSYPSPRPAESD